MDCYVNDSDEEKVEQDKELVQTKLDTQIDQHLCLQEFCKC